MAQAMDSPPIGPPLRHWRGLRRFSQLELGLQADVSARHISFIETGRARPSREMVLQLARILDVPLREQNTLLTAAGFAPRYRETGLDDPELALVRQALEHILTGYEPHGALVADRMWNLLLANRSVRLLMAHFLPEQAAGGDGPLNLIRLVLEPDGLRPHIVNWREMAGHFVQRLHQESLAQGGVGPLAELLDEVLSIPGVPANWSRPDPDRYPAPMLQLHLAKDGLELKLFSTVTTFGTAQDVSLQELRIESFHPADEASNVLLHQLVAHA